LTLTFNPLNPNILIIGGVFTTPGNRICYVDVTTNNYGTYGAGFANDQVRKIGVHPITGTIYVVGSFTLTGSNALNYTAYFDNTTSTWLSMGLGVVQTQNPGSQMAACIAFHPQTGGNTEIYK